MSNKKKIGIMIFFFISIIAYKINERPVYGCFEKSQKRLVSDYGINTIKTEFNPSLNHVWVMSTYDIKRSSVSEIDDINAAVIDTFIMNCESYLTSTEFNENTKFLYRSSVLSVDKKDGGRYMLKTKKGKKYSVKDPKTKRLVDYVRK